MAWLLSENAVAISSLPGGPLLEYSPRNRGGLSEASYDDQITFLTGSTLLELFVPEQRQICLMK